MCVCVCVAFLARAYMPHRPHARDGLVAFMAASGEFELVEEGSIPFLIREHARKFQLVYPHLSVFRRKTAL